MDFKLPEGYKIRTSNIELNTRDLDNHMALQSNVLKELESEGKEGYILPKSRKTMSDFIKKHHVLGTYFNNGEMPVAQVSLFFPKNDSNTEIECFGNFRVQKEKIAMVKGLEVSKNHRGKKLAKANIEMSEFLSSIHNRDTIITDIAASNMPSIIAFLHSGYSIFTADHPKDDVPLVIVGKNLEQKNTDLSGKCLKVDINDFLGLQDVTKSGFYPKKVVGDLYYCYEDEFFSSLLNTEKAEILNSNQVTA